MDLSSLTQRQRRHVQAIIDTGSIRGAAERLGCNPSEVREVLKQAERKLPERVPRALEEAPARITTEGNGWGVMRTLVAQLDAEGLTQAEIAARIGRTVSTVNSHLQNIRRFDERQQRAVNGQPKGALEKKLEAAAAAGQRCACGMLLPCWHPDPVYPSTGTSNLGEAGRR